MRLRVTSGHGNKRFGFFYSISVDAGDGSPRHEEIQRLQSNNVRGRIERMAGRELVIILFPFNPPYQKIWRWTILSCFG